MTGHVTLMPAALAKAKETPHHDIDQRVFLYGISWQRFLGVLAAKGESSAVRITYIDGTLELMSPSVSHEGIEKDDLPARRNVRGRARRRSVGRWLVDTEERLKKLGIEPDECDCIGKPPEAVPDLAIEVIWTSGGLDKLDVYRGLGVRDVWVYEDGKLDVYSLRGERYVRAARSKLLPDIDLARVAALASRPDQPVAIREFRAELRRG